MNGYSGSGKKAPLLGTDYGQSVFTRSDNQIGDLEPLYKSESIPAILVQLAKIMRDCPELFPGAGTPCMG